MVYSAGAKHQVADALSRLSTIGSNTTPTEDNLLLLAVRTTISGDAPAHFTDTTGSSYHLLDAMFVSSGTPQDKVEAPATPTTAEIIREQPKETYNGSVTLQVKQPST